MFHIPHDWHRGGPARDRPAPFLASLVYGFLREFATSVIRCFTADTLLDIDDTSPQGNEAAERGTAPPNWPYPF